MTIRTGNTMRMLRGCSGVARGVRVRRTRATDTIETGGAGDGGHRRCAPDRAGGADLVMRDQTLLGPDNSPAVVEGYGPVPAFLARSLVSGAVTDKRSLATLRRLYRHPSSGALVAMESRSRRFPRGLATFIGLRDQTCRTPYCDAPIRHRDHSTPRNRGGPTSGLNGLGMCERCNYTKESPGWRVSTSDESGVHTAEFVTPTGARYHSTAPRCRPAGHAVAKRS